MYRSPSLPIPIAPALIAAAPFTCMYCCLASAPITPEASYACMHHYVWASLAQIMTCHLLGA